MMVHYAGLSRLSESTATELTMTAHLLQASFALNSNYEISFRYNVVDIKRVIRHDSYDRAQRLILESVSDPALISQYKDAGRIRREHEITLAFNIYFKGHSLKWQNDMNLCRHDLLSGELHDYFARSQVQLSF